MIFKKWLVMCVIQVFRCIINHHLSFVPFKGTEVYLIGRKRRRRRVYHLVRGVSTVLLIVFECHIFFGLTCGWGKKNDELMNQNIPRIINYL